MDLTLPAGWRLHAVTETGSTNADVAEAARRGAPEGLVVTAERQTAGRGRLDRSWESPAGAGLMFSVLLRPAVPVARWGWLPLLAGVALAHAVRGTAALDAELKWPNDLLVGGRKCAGILAEAVPDGVVIGIGLNVSLTEEELPTGPTGLAPTSLLLAGADDGRANRAALLEAILRGLAEWAVIWNSMGGDPVASGLREAYLGCCGTIGQQVRAVIPGGGESGGEIIGLADTVDADGRLVIIDASGARQAVAAADVIHVRPHEAGLDGRH
ncbi:biotin--[acetyl-CoA-carboxylase] ligase [Allocatelliglobosispora scoriae]|nr:biotin--[acetyl-CoA-carboxylase] ligase [Allocatelliglobosispora scoriae]